MNTQTTQCWSSHIFDYTSAQSLQVTLPSDLLWPDFELHFIRADENGPPYLLKLIKPSIITED